MTDRSEIYVDMFAQGIYLRITTNTIIRFASETYEIINNK